MTHTCSITGINGFLGRALSQRLTEMGWKVYPYLRKDVEYLFLFGSASSDMWFKQACDYNIRETIENFINAAEFCTQYNIKLIYPSSGTVYEGNTMYARTKRVIEGLAQLYDETLGLRIFASYGPGEWSKSDYASVVYLFTRAMREGRRPEIWGKGTQKRDFIYIDDVINAIIRSIDTKGIIDIGTGKAYSFNQLVAMINKELGTHLRPKYIDRPANYVDETICEHPCRCSVSLEQGIRNIIQSL